MPASSSPSSASAPPRGKKLRSRLARWFRLLLAVVAIAGLVLAGLLWNQERKLSAAAAAVEQDDTKYAMYLVSRLLASTPDDTRVLALRARLHVKLGQPDEAIQIFDRIGPASAEDLHAFATAYMLREEWSSALPLLTRVLQLTPNDSDALYEITSCQMRLGKYDEALVNAQRFGEASGQLARADVIAGSIHGMMGNLREAAESFARVLEREPRAENLQFSAAEFYLRYGRVLMGLGKPQEALMPLKLSAAGQENGEVFTLLGDAASQLGQQENAVLAWKKAIEVDPENTTDARESLANAALLTRDAEQALKWLEPLRDRENPSSSIAYLFQRAYSLLGNETETSAWQEKAGEARRKETVIAAVNNFVVADPNAFWSRAARAHQFASENNWGEAEVLVEGLIREAPGDPFIIELADAVRRRTELPALSRIPVVQR